MDAQGSSVIGLLYRARLAVWAAVLVVMLVTLARAVVDAEGRKLIVGKASTWTLIATVGGQIIDLVCSVVQAPSYEPSAPFVQLTVAALMYAIFLGWFKHKYGG